NVGEGTDSVRDLPDAHLFPRLGEAADLAANFSVPVGELETESRRFGVYSVGAADADGVTELLGAGAENMVQRLEASGDRSGSLLDLEGLRGIDHVVGGEAVVEPPGGLGLAGCRHLFGDRSGEGDDVVLHVALDFLDAAGVEGGVLLQSLGRLAGNFTHLGQGLGGG